MIFLKRAVSPVVATALLLVVAVSAVVGFSGWFSEFNSNLFVDVDLDSSSSSSVRVEGIFNDVLYLKSNSKTDLSLLSIIDSDGVEACSFSGNSEVNSSGLVGHWDFSNTGDGIIHDLSGNGNDGKLYGDTRLLLDFDLDYKDKTTYNESYIYNLNESKITHISSGCISGNCYSFDGSNSSDLNRGIVIGNTNFEFGNKNLSFSTSSWFKKIGNSTGPGTILVQKRTSTPYTQFGVNLGNEGDINTFYYDKEGVSRSKYLYNKIELHKWHHFVTSYNYDTSELRLYLDGDLMDVTLFTGLIIGNGGSFRVGTNNDPFSRYSYRFNGSIDEVSIYSKALSSIEILELYNSQKAGFVEFNDDGLEFDGIDDYVSVNSTKFDATYDQFSVWVEGSYNSLSKQNLNSRVPFVSNWNTWDIGSQEGFMISIFNNYPEDTSYFNSIFNNNLNDHQSAYYDINDSSDTFINKHPFEKKMIFGTIFNSSIIEQFYMDKFINSSNGSFINLNIEESTPIFFGRTGINPSYLNGQIDEIRIYNRTLSINDIEGLYWNSLKTQEVGINKIDLSSCNLNSNEKYNVLVGGDNGLIDVEVIPQ